MSERKPPKVVIKPPESGSRSRQGPGTSALLMVGGIILIAGAGWWVGFQSGTRDRPGDQPSSSHLDADSSSPDSQQVFIVKNSGTASPKAGDSHAGPAQGGIRLTSEPEDAQFELRHRETPFQTVANGPVTLSQLPAGSYELTTTRPGFLSSSTSLNIVAGEVRTLPPIRLIPATGTVEFPTVPGISFEIRPDHSSASQDPSRVHLGVTPQLPPPLAVGRYDLLLRKEGRPDHRETFLISGGKITTISDPFVTGNARFESEPAGAEVWIRSQTGEALRFVGKTPLEVSELSPGFVEADFRLQDLPSRRIQFTVRSGETSEASASWKVFPVTISSDPPGAEILIGGKKPTAEDTVTPLEITLGEGRHEIEAFYPGLTRLSRPLILENNAPEPVHFTFRHARLELTSEPSGAAVYLQDRALGKTPLLLPGVPPGQHEFLLRLEGHARTTVDLVLRNGETRQAHTALAINPEPEPGYSFSNGQELRMVWIPRFQGWAQATEIPQRVYRAVMGTNPSEFAGPELPVENVTWTDAFRFCEKLTTTEQGLGFLPAGYEYTLPTDDQWSFLAQGSTLEQSIHSLGPVRQGPAPIGSLTANSLGIHDAIGNVWEWCLDWYSPAVVQRAIRDGAPSESEKAGATHKVLRGGSWNRSLQNQLLLGARRAASPNQHKDYETGFRVVLVPRSN